MTHETGALPTRGQRGRAVRAAAAALASSATTLAVAALGEPAASAPVALLPLPDHHAPSRSDAAGGGVDTSSTASSSSSSSDDFATSSDSSAGSGPSLAWSADTGATGGAAPARLDRATASDALAWVRCRPGAWVRGSVRALGSTPDKLGPRAAAVAALGGAAALVGGPGAPLAASAATALASACPAAKPLSIGLRSALELAARLEAAADMPPVDTPPGLGAVVRPGAGWWAAFPRCLLGGGGAGVRGAWTEREQAK